MRRSVKSIVTLEQSGHSIVRSRPQRSDFGCLLTGSKQYNVLLTFGLKNSRPLAAIGVVQARGAKPRLCQRILPVFKSRAYNPLVLTAYEILADVSNTGAQE